MNKKSQSLLLWQMLLSLSLLILSSSVLADWQAPAVGSKFAHSVPIENERGVLRVPLPHGEWVVVYTGSDRGSTHVDLTPGDDFAVIILIQTQGENVRHVLWIRSNTTNRTTRYTDDLCKDQSSFIFRDRFDSSVWSQRCLTVNLDTGYLLQPKGWWNNVFAYFVGHDLQISSTELLTFYTEYDSRGSRLEVSMTSNPVSFGYPDSRGDAARSPWSRVYRAKDPAKTGFVDDWVVYSQNYANALHSAMLGDKTYPLAEFVPKAASLPYPPINHLSRLPESESRESQLAEQCVSIGFKPGTAGLKDCIAELRSRKK